MTNKSSEAVYTLWGKKAANGDPRWLPLIVHLADTAEVGKLLWDEWGRKACALPEQSFVV